MGVIIIVIPLAILAAVLHFVFSAKVAGWVVWVALVYFVGGFLYKSLATRRSFRKGKYLREGEILAMVSQPYVSSITIIIMIALLFVDYSKLHLLWIYPIVSAVFEFIFGRKLVRIIDKKNNGELK